MKLEVGKTYRRRDGVKRTITSNKGMMYYPEYKYFSEGVAYKENGAHGGTYDSPLDFVSEVGIDLPYFNEDDVEFIQSSGTKNDGGKVRLDLLSFPALEVVAEVMTFGAKKYDDNNWRKGFNYSRLTGATLRHIFAWIKGEEKDPESGISHLAHAICCLMFLLEFTITGKGTDDRYKDTE